MMSDEYPSSSGSVVLLCEEVSSVQVSVCLLVGRLCLME